MAQKNQGINKRPKKRAIKKKRKKSGLVHMDGSLGIVGEGEKTERGQQRHGSKQLGRKKRASVWTQSTNGLRRSTGKMDCHGTPPQTSGGAVPNNTEGFKTGQEERATR